MKLYLKRTICILLAVCLALSGVWYIDRVLRLKRNDGILTMQSFYRQPGSSVDLLLIGNSHSGINIDTATLWNDYGFSCYDLWGGVQPLWNSYHFLVEALKYQRPKLIVLEVTASSSDYEYSEEQNQLKNIAGMKFSANKIAAVKASAPKDRWLNLLLGFPLYHGRFNELEMEDFMHFPWSEGQENFKGSYLLYGVGNYQFESAEGVTEAVDIMSKEREYLLKCINLCEEEEIPLLLVKTPALERIEMQKYYNTVSQIADVHNLPFVNMNLLDEEVGITAEDWSLDRHMNGEGARKVAAYLGQYIQENFSLPDHRGDSAYFSWDINAHKVNNDYLAAISEAEDYFEELSRNPKSLVIIKNSPWEDDKEYRHLRDLLHSVGMDTSLLDSCEQGAWFVEGNVSSPEKDGDTMLFDLDGQALEVNFEYMTLSYAGKQLAWFGSSDILCAVYDNFTHEFVDLTGYSSGHHYQLDRIEK